MATTAIVSPRDYRQQENALLLKWLTAAGAPIRSSLRTRLDSSSIFATDDAKRVLLEYPGIYEQFLTERDAAIGHPPKSVDCRRCGGSGEVDRMQTIAPDGTQTCVGSKTCPRCGGDGDEPGPRS